MADPIKIVLTADASAAAMAIAETVQASEQAIRGKLITAMQDAERQLFKVTEQQKVLNATISENGKVIDQLKSKRDSANKEELNALDQQIKKLEQINQQHQRELTNLETKRTKYEGIKTAANAANESDRLGVQLATQDRLVTIKTLDDQKRAVESVKVASTQQHDSAAKELDALTQKQQKNTQVIDAHKQRIEALQQVQKTVGLEEQANLQREIDSLQKVIDKHQNETSVIEEKKIALQGEMEISQANTEEHIRAIEEEVAARQAAIQATREQTSAAGQMTDSIEDEETSTKRLSDAVGKVGKEAEEGGFKVGSLMNAFGGIYIVVAVAQQLAEAFQTASRDAEQMVDSMQKLRDMSGSTMDKARPLFAAYGAEDRPSRAQLSSTVADVMSLTREDADKTISAMVGLQPAFEQAKLSPNSARAKAISGVATRYLSEGSGQLNADVLGYQIRGLLQKNPNMSADQLNQELANELAASGNNYTAMNAMLSGYQEQQTAGNLVGFGFSDYEGFVNSLRKTLTPDAFRHAMQQGIHGDLHALGMTQEEVVKHLGGLVDLSNTQKSQLSVEPTQQKKLDYLLRILPKGMQPAGKYFQQAMTSGTLLGSGWENMVSGLDPTDRARLLADVVGVRNIGGAENMQVGGTLPTGTPLPIQQPNWELSEQAGKDITDFRALAQVPSVSQAGLTQDQELKSVFTNIMGSNPGLFPAGANPADMQIEKFGADLLFHGDNAKGVIAANVMALHIAQLAQWFEAVKAGKVKFASPQDRTKKMSQASDLMIRMSQSLVDLGYKGGLGTNGQDAMLQALELGSGNDASGKSISRADALKTITQKGDEFSNIDDILLMGQMKDAIPYKNINTSIINTTPGAETEQFLEGMQNQQLMQQQGPPSPAPQGTKPMSIINQRIYNYGIPSSNLGVPQDWENNYG